MVDATFWGCVAASALVIAAEVSFRVELGRRLVGLIMAFGVGTLISSIAFELVEPALAATGETWPIVIGMAAGSLVFFAGDRAVAGLGAPRRKGAVNGQPSESSGLGIALGTALDGVPESLVLGMSVASLGGVGPALLAAIWISNFPESLGSSVDLRSAGRSRTWIRVLWWGVVAMSALAAGLGFALVNTAGPSLGAFVQAFAAGALLTMIADEMAPQAFGRSALSTGLATTGGFVVAFLLSSLE
jgi:ZIP family zinc transporter